MRFYCLSNITVIPPKLYPTDFEEISEKERLSIRDEIRKFLDISYSSVHAADFENLDIYQLTEISIGYIKPYEDTPQEKVYVLNIYRRDLHFMETLAISLFPFTIDLLESSGNVIEFSIPYSRILTPWTTEHYDLEIKLRCIKNTPVKQIISDEEEAAYDRFEKDIEAFANGNADLREEAFKHFHLILPNTSEPKYLSEKIRKFKKYIEWCCDPENGDPKNVPDTSDYSQKLKSFLQQRDRWIITDDSTHSQPAVRSEFSSSHRNCREIYWVSPNFVSLNLQNFHSKYLQKIKISNINLMDHYETLHSCIRNVNFLNLADLTLSYCGLGNLPEEIFSNLSISLKLLDLNHNKITNVSRAISRLIGLENLNLWKNDFLNDNGIPWKYLPHSIKVFNICETSITRVPVEIERLYPLEYLFAAECKNLEFVAWENISKTIISIDVGGGKALNTVSLREKKSLIILKIVDSQLQTFDDAHLPVQLQTLSLRHNNLRRFNLVLPNLQCLYLTGNEFDKFRWKILPETLIELDLSQNNLTSIGDISHLVNLERLLVNSNNINHISKMNFANLKSLLIVELARNDLSKLPKGFENIPNDISLDLSENNFNGTSDDIDEELWHRIPKLLLFLRLDYNTLIALPCALKNLKMVQLFVKHCNLFYMCSHVADNISYIDIRGNPGIQNLPFVPAAGYENLPRNSKQLMKLKNRPDNVLTLKTDNQKLRSTARIYEKILKYTFKKANIDIFCDCCACCGEETDEDVVEQVMIMDFFITFRTEKKEVEKDWLFIDGIPQNLPMGFSPGNWKTNVVTRLCKNCIENLKDIQNNFESIDSENNDEDHVESKRPKEVIINPTNIFFDVPVLEDPDSLIGQVVDVYSEPQKPESLHILSMPTTNYQAQIHNSYGQIYASAADPDIQILHHQTYTLPHADHSIYSYNVPTIEWLQQTCNNLSIRFEYYMFQHSIYVPDIYGFTPEMIAEVESDGHCGFRALSVLLSGNQQSHGILRRKIAETILSNNDPNFETFPFFENAKADAVNHLSINPDGFCPAQYWMSCVHLSAAAYLLNTNICVKSANDPFGWRLYNPTSFRYGIHNSIFDPNIPTLILDNSSQNHFNAILTIKNNNALQNPLNW